ncbi:MAG: peptidyl-prolyl cis-trans isomerase [Spirochaetales bacterium]
MKKSLLSVAVFLLALGLGAQGLDQAVAKVTLYKTTVISQKTFREQVAALESTTKSTLTADDKVKLLNSLVLNELINQDSDKKGLKASDEEVLAQFRSSNPGATDAQIKQALEQQSGVTWDKAVVSLKKQIVFLKYLGVLSKDKPTPKLDVSAQEISDFYTSNKALFVSPDYVRVSHIFFDTKVNPKGSLTDIKKRADDSLAKITAGQSTFEELANTVSEDEGSSKLNGDMGYIPRTLESALGQQLTNLFGNDFLNAIFALKKGEVSKVLTSNSGLHIVRVTQKLDQHFLTLDEAVYPGKKTPTVKDTILQTLQQRKVSAYQQQLVTDAGDALKKQAKIDLFKQNL